MIPCDRWILSTVILLLLVGLLMVASASMVISDQHFGQPFHFFFHQLFYLTVGLVVVGAMYKMNPKMLYSISPYLIILSIVLLVLVLIPGIGHQVNGSRRWFRLGPFSLQVSEFVKAFVILFMAGYITRHLEVIRHQVSGFVKPMVLLGAMMVLLLLEPITTMGMMFLAGVKLRQFIALLFVVVVGLGIIAVAAPYRLARLTAFLHPWANQFDSGYQLTQSLIAFGRGGVSGVGLGNSVQKLFYLPEAHTDFLFAVLAEELGLMGEIVVVVLFSILVMRIFYIARLAEEQHKLFESFLAYGYGLWIALQMMINIGVNMGVLPTKGLTLPFLSYGGSSVLINCFIVGILLRISHDVSGQVKPDSFYGHMPKQKRRKNRRQ